MSLDFVLLKSHGHLSGQVAAYAFTAPDGRYQATEVGGDTVIVDLRERRQQRACPTALLPPPQYSDGSMTNSCDARYNPIFGRVLNDVRYQGEIPAFCVFQQCMMGKGTSLR